MSDPITTPNWGDRLDEIEDTLEEMVRKLNRSHDRAAAAKAQSVLLAVEELQTALDRIGANEREWPNLRTTRVRVKHAIDLSYQAACRYYARREPTENDVPGNDELGNILYEAFPEGSLIEEPPSP